jgi:hypothetical protein
MWPFLASALAAIPSAATSTFSLIAFALAVAAYVFTVWRVVRNKNLLQYLQKLPPKDRLGALETELGGATAATAGTPRILSFSSATSHLLAVSARSVSLRHRT